MNTTSLITWEDRLTRLSLALLITATVYGIVAGASVTMYYDVVPNMAALEDSLGAVQGRLFLLALPRSVRGRSRTKCTSDGFL